MKVFRKARFKKLKKYEVFSYLAYMLGEIALVVIGILIAVYINNKNEEKKYNKEIKNILSIIETDIEDDIKEAYQIILSEESKESNYNRFFENKLTSKDYKSDYSLKRLIFGYPEISFNKRGFNLLNENKNLDAANDSLIIKIIDLYTHRIYEVKADDELRKIEFNETYAYFKNQPWWYEFIEGLTVQDKFESKGFVEYALNSNDYKNKVSSWYFINKFVLLPEIKKFIEEAEAILTLIKKRESNLYL